MVSIFVLLASRRESSPCNCARRAVGYLSPENIVEKAIVKWLL
jgi:hypothetical protein